MPHRPSLVISLKRRLLVGSGGSLLQVGGHDRTFRRYFGNFGVCSDDRRQNDLK